MPDRFAVYPRALTAWFSVPLIVEDGTEIVLFGNTLPPMWIRVPVFGVGVVRFEADPSSDRLVYREVAGG